MKCRLCSADFCIKTDPKNADYIAEHGIERAYEPWRERERQEKIETEIQKKKEVLDATASIQLQTEQTKKQFEELDRLDYLKRLSTRQGRISSDKLMAVIERNDVKESVHGMSTTVEPPLSSEDFKQESVVEQLKKDKASSDHSSRLLLLNHLEEEVEPVEPPVKATCLSLVDYSDDDE
ncbi:hypothetical protein GEMRC1_010310 [Eukaryota sp. GEM-RC1]